MERKEKERIFDTGPEREGVLATFAARSVIGYAIGIYGVDGLNDIDMMRIIHNAFAHSTSDLDLNMHPFAESCNFNFLRKAANVSLFRPLPENPLEKFAAMAFYLVNLLLMQEYYVKHDIINQNPWTDFF